LTDLLTEDSIPNMRSDWDMIWDFSKSQIWVWQRSYTLTLCVHRT